jgi:outer membrane murein-binding lipoprotein Lpp
MKSRLILLAIISAALLSGCNNNSEQSLWTQIQQLAKEKTDLKVQLEKTQKENEQLKTQLVALSSLDRQVRLEALSGLQRIQISKRTGLYDKDDDVKLESFIVYVQPFDDTGDTVKIVGKMIIQLWDLNAQEEHAQIAEWQVEPEQLKESWADTFMTNYYRLKFDEVNLLALQQKELTVKVTFIDYLTGKTLQAQKVVKL